jgi:hypothetical protein
MTRKFYWSDGLFKNDNVVDKVSREGFRMDRRLYNVLTRALIREEKADSFLFI